MVSSASPGQPGADGGDKAVFAEDIRVLQDPVAVVAGDGGPDVFQQQGGHGGRSFPWRGPVVVCVLHTIIAKMAAECNRIGKTAGEGPPAVD